MRRFARASLLAVPLLVGAGCGGGGGDDDSAPCVVPGTLRALAVQGAPALGTAGAFGAFPVDLLLDTAPGGWSVFEATTGDPLNAQCIYVAQPDASLLKVFAKGETVPAPGDGTISDFLVARVNGAGQVLVEVAITGDTGGRDFGLLTAQVVGGVVTSKVALIYEGFNMGPSGVAGNLADIDEGRIWFQADGRTFFGGTTSTPHEAAWVVNLDGTGLDDLIATGDLLPDGAGVAVCVHLKALGVSADGSRFGFAADVGGPFEDRLYVGNTGTTTLAEVASDGNALPGGGVVQEVYGGGDLLVFNNAFVMWQAEGSTALSDDVVLYGSPTTPYIELARTADPAPGSGGFFGELRFVRHRQQCVFPAVDADLLLVPGGADFAMYVLGSGAPLLSIYEGRPAPPDLGEATVFTDLLPGLAEPQRFDVSPDGSFAFGGLMANGTSGIFWLIPACGTFTLAKSGGPAPVTGGDTFGAFAPQAAHTCHDDVVLFRALLTTNGSGVFRQGP
jgi:hypothetical protein